MNSTKIKILVIDDHQALRHGLISLLHCVDNFQVVQEAPNGKIALELLKEYFVDVALLDVEMPVMNGTETLMHIKKKFPDVKVIMFTSHQELFLGNYYLNLGADAFLVKNSSFEQISETIVNVASGLHNKNTDEITEIKVSGEFLQLALTEIEKKIVKLLCESHNNRTISETLGISENTVKYHRKNIYSKTRTKSLSELIVYAIKQGIITVK